MDIQGKRKRPMSAKNPLLQKRLNRNEPYVTNNIGDDIINIQN